MYVMGAVFPATFNCMSACRVGVFILTKVGGLVKRRNEARLSSKEGWKQGGNCNNCKSWSLCGINKQQRRTYIWATRGNELENRIVLSENGV